MAADDPIQFRDSYIQQGADGSRRGKIVTLLGLSGYGDNEEIRGGSLYTPVSAFLAWREMQTRSGAILPRLPELLEGCDMQWNYEARDTSFLPLQAVKQLLEATGKETFQAAKDVSGIPQEDEEEEEDAVLLLTPEEEEQIQNASPLDTLPPRLPLPETDAPARTVAPRTNPPQRTIAPRETDPPLISEDQLVFERGHGEQQTTNDQGQSTRRRATQTQPQHETFASEQRIDHQAESHSTSATRLQQGHTRNHSEAERQQAMPIARHRLLQDYSYDVSRVSPLQIPLEDQQQSTPKENDILSLLEENKELYAFGMIGAFSSKVSQTLSILGNALAVPQLSGSSTSAALNEAPLFARTINTDDGQAEAFIHYMQHLNVTHVANIYVKDSYGTRFHQSLVTYADAYGIKLKGISYIVGKEAETITNLIESQYRYVYATIVEWEPLMGAAYRAGVMGVPHYAWYMAEKFILASPTFEERDSDVAHALSGIGLINVYQKAHPGVHQALLEFANNTSLQQEFIASHVLDAPLFDDYTFLPPTPHANQYLFFDAVLALGLASCGTPGLFTGVELFEQLLQLEFEGVTGKVSFDEYGTRAFEGLEYRVDNLRLSTSRSETNAYRFDASLAAVLAGTNVTEVNPFLFNNGEYQFTTAIPSPLPPVEENFNFVPNWALGLGYSLGSVIMAVSLLLAVWTWRRRESYVIKAAQPPFLVQLCCGTLVYSAAVFPLSLEGGGPDEETNPQKYNVACMSSIWMLFLGFVISFSAILAKTLRLNKLLNSGNRIRRVQIQAKDAMKPFVILMAINVTMLLGMTFASPFEFRRISLNNFDAFGRSVESYGACRATSYLVLAFLAPMATANGVGIVWAARQLYKARHLPMEFSETHYLGISMASLTETFLLSAPVLLYLRTKPTAYFLFATVAVCFLSLSFLIPVFLPKWLHRNQKANLGRAQANMLAQAAQRRRATTFHNTSTHHARSTFHNPSTFASGALPSSFGFDDESASVGSYASSRASGYMMIHRKK